MPLNLTQSQIDTGLLYPDNWWSNSQLTYSIPTAGSTWTYSGEPTSGSYTVLSVAQAAFFDQAVQIWDSLIAPGITKTVDTTTQGSIRVAFTPEDAGTWGYAYQPAFHGGASTPIAGDIWINTSNLSDSFAPGTYDFQAMMHELGHALGLKHSFDAPVLPSAYDSTRYTIMSYTQPTDGQHRYFTFSGGSLHAFADNVNAITPMVVDIAAIQDRYGADTTTRATATTYTFDPTLTVFQTIWDAGGTDAFDLTTSTRANIIDLNPGSYSSIGIYPVAQQISDAIAQFGAGFTSFITSWLSSPSTFTWTDNVGIAFGTVIENAFGGSAADTITGNSADNILRGNAGNDILNGGAGSDVLNGGTGDDILTAGGHTAGADVMYGGAGNDTYFVNSGLTGAQDIVFEGALFPGSDAGPGDIDTIHNTGALFWDFYSVGEILYNDTVTTGGEYLVGGKDVLNKQFFGSAGTDIISTYGHNSTVDAGAGSDAIILDLYGLDSATYRGVNNIVMKPGSGLDYVYNFLPGTDHIDLSAFHYAITAAQVASFAVDVDNPGTANDYTFIYLGAGGGVGNYIVFMGVLASQLHAGDFIM